MAKRTNKQKRGTGYKFSGTKTGKKKGGNKSRKKSFYRLRRLSTSQALEEGIIHAIENPKGHSYYWFRFGEKKCWETKMKFDPDGYNRWGEIHPRASKFIKSLR